MFTVKRQVIAAFSVGVISWGAILSAAELSPEMQRIYNRKKLVIAIEKKDKPPFFFTDKDGKLAGLEIDLAQIMAQELGLTLEFQRQSLTEEEVLRSVAEGRADIGMSRISATLQRATHVKFSRAYLYLKQTLLLNRLKAAASRKPALTATKNPKGKRTVGIIDGSAYGGFAKNDFPDAAQIPYKSSADMFKDVSNGTIHLALSDEMEVKHWLQIHPDAGIQLQTVIYDDRIDLVAFALNWRDETLKSWVNLFIEIMDRNGALKRLSEKYLKVEPWLGS